MPVTREEFDVYRCDSCGKELLCEPDDITEAYGFHGTVMRVSEFGGTGQVEWYACKITHVKDAITRSMQRALENGNA